MRKKITWLLTAIMLLSAVMLSGCGSKKVTAESLVKEVNENSEKVKSFSGDLDMQMSINMSQDGYAMDMDMGMEGTFEATTNPEIFHMATKLKMDLLGVSMDMDVYSQKDGDKVNTYVGMAGNWTKTEEDASKLSQGNLDEMYSVVDGADMTLAEKTEEYNGKEVYVLTGTVTGDKLQEVMGAMGNVTSDMDLDISGMEANMTLKVYKDTKLPATVTIEMKDNGDGIDADGVTIKFNTMVMTMNYTEFDTVDSITIPEEALKADTIDADDVLDAESGVLESEEGAAETETAGETMAETTAETATETNSETAE